MNLASDGDTDSNLCTWYSRQRIDTWTGGFGNKKTSGNHSNYSFIEIGKNTEKSREDLRRLAITQTPVRNHWCETLVWKALKRIIIIIIIIIIKARLKNTGYILHWKYENIISNETSIIVRVYFRKKKKQFR